MTTEMKCKVSETELNSLDMQRKNKQTEVDGCNPTEAAARKTKEALAANTAFMSQSNDKLKAVYAELERNWIMADRISDSSEPLNNYKQKLISEKHKLDEKHVNLEQDERRYRRNFLDNDPQSGTGIGIRSSDDKVLLTFWVCFGAAVISFTLIVLKFYGVNSTSDQAKISLGVLAMSYGISYYLIINYG